MPGPTPYAKRAISEEKVSSAWRLMISESMLRHIKKCTDAEGKRQLQNDSWSITIHKIEAFIALIYARGAYGARKISIKKLWSKNWGPSFFRDTMSRNDFTNCMSLIRFDIRNTRSQRLATDKFALASEIWNPFIENCILCYKPGEYIAIDEQLLPTKARCRFTQYMANKPDKFGIKFWLAADVKSKYLINGFPYLGKDDQRPQNRLLGEHVVLKLMDPFLNKGRNVTTDNFFTSVKLAKELEKKGTSLVGTVNRSKREIPPVLKQSRENLYSSKIYKHENLTLTVYQGKPNKNVLLLSTMHPNVEIAEGQKKLPETVKFYNETKFGVDVVDQMARQYSTKSSSRRWPLQVFFNVLDLAAINAWVLYKEVTKQKISRQDFIFKLAEELREDYIKNEKLTTRPETQEASSSETNNKRRQCQVARCKKNKTREICVLCKKAVCGTCTGKIETKCYCVICLENINY